MPTLTQEQLKEVLSYNPNTGDWFWLINASRNAQKGSVAGCWKFDNRSNQWRRSVVYQGHKYLTARLAFLFMKGYIPEQLVDHEDRDTRNEKWFNLRHVSASCNSRNRKQNITNTSGITGVVINKWGRWTAQIQLRDCGTKSKTCDSFDEAVYLRLAMEQHHNWNHCDKQSDAFKYVNVQLANKEIVEI